jgi:hypothetical protein
LSQERLAQLASIVVGVSAFAAYAVACAPAPYLLDSAELAQAAFGLGIPHPPGEPVAALLGKIFCLVPAGSVALRVGLSQAAAGAVAAVLLLRIALRVVALVDGEQALSPLARAFLATAAALGFAFAPGALIAADRPEVYAVQTALSLGALLCALRALAEDDPRFLLLAAVLLGLGVANHPLVAGLVGVGAAVAAVPWLRARPAPVARVARLMALSVLALLAGLAVNVYLPARAGALFAQAAARGGDTVAWGDPRTLSGLGWVLSAHTFATKTAVVHTAAAPFDLPFVLMEELEVTFALLAPVGMIIFFRRAGRRLPGLVLLLGWAGSITAALIAGFDPANPDIRGYLGPALALTAVFTIAAIAAGLAPLARWKRSALTPALAGALAAATFTRFPAPDRYPALHAARAADALTGDLLAALPPRAALFTAHFESAFLVGYQRLVEGRRPDVAWAHLGFLAHPGARARLSAAEPALRPVLAGVTGLPTLTALLELDRRHPVRVQPDPHLSAPLRARLVPDVLTWKLRGGEAREDRAIPRPPALAVALAEAGADRQVRGFLGWSAYSDAILACENQLPEAARSSLALLHELLPADVLAQGLTARCAALSNISRSLRATP